MASDDGRLRLGEGLVACAFAVATLAVLMPWPRPALGLETCTLQPVARFGYQCDLAALSARVGAGWLRQSVRVYEDGVRLRDGASVGDVGRVHPGSYYTDGRVLTFSALDGADPRNNGWRYEVRSMHPVGPWRADRPLRKLCAGVILAGVLGVLCWRRRERWRATLWSTGLGAALACALVQVVAVLQESPVHVDAGYLLPAAEAVSRGGVPYASVLYNYTPLGLYAFNLWSRLWPGSGFVPHAWYLGLVLLSELACAFLVFRILRRAGCAADVAALVAACCFSMALWFDGARILQEPLYLIPILACAGLAASPRTAFSGILSGALAAVALLVKQYGGFGLWGLLGASLWKAGDRLKSAAAVVLGFLGALCTLVLVTTALGVDLGGLARQALGASYPRRYEAVWLKLFLWTCPIALPALLSPFLREAWARPATRVAVAFGVASLMPFYFRQHQYYFQNVIPWIFVLFALGVDTLTRAPRPAAGLVHGVAVALLLSMPVRAAADQGALLSREIRSEQTRRARLMTKAWAADQPTLLLAHPGFYAITRYRSADEASLGYRFAHELTADQLRWGFQQAGAVWIDRNILYARGADQVLRSAGTSIDAELSRNGYEQRRVLEDRFELWTRSSTHGVRP
jgi:hypothetical protein